MPYILHQQIWHLKTASGMWDLRQATEPEGPPFYLYNLADALERADRASQSGFGIHYALKANSHPRLLAEFSKRGLGADVVSLGELKKAMAHGFAANRVIFSGVAKDKPELQFALAQGIFQINCESFEELALLQQTAVQMNVVAPVALRINIHLSAPTHQHVQTATPDSKFGIDIENLPEVLAWLKGKPGLALKAIATHIGSQITDVSVFGRMAEQMGKIYRDLQTAGYPLERLDLGGGLGLNYQSTGEEDASMMQEYLQLLKKSHGTDAKILIEPGRSLVARMGVLLARTIYVKSTSRQKFLILNAGMNTLMRPALYQAFHRIAPLEQRTEQETYTVVGPICESTDKFAVDRRMSRVQRGDWVAIFDAGAYGAVMANTYNESPLPAEKIFFEGRLEEL